MSFLGFVEGPLFTVAAIVFVLGVIWKLAGILFLGIRPDYATPRGSALGGAVITNIRHLFPRRIFLANGGLFHFLTGYAFHIGLFILLIFALPHMTFLKDRIFGFGWPALPRWAFIVMAELALGGLLLLWIRRLSDPVQRLVSEPADHISTGLTLLVMLTGCFALQISHDVLRAIHMLLADLWLIYFPFGRLMHSFTFLFSRGMTGAAYGRRGVAP